MEDKSLKQFADLTASKDPTPGGGGVTAYVRLLVRDGLQSHFRQKELYGIQF